MLCQPDCCAYFQVTQESTWELTEEEAATLLPPLDPYDNPLVMPLSDFVRHPIARELLHDGQTLQVGLADVM